MDGPFCTHWWDGGSTSGPIASSWNVEGWPTLYILDHKGVIRHKFLGFPGEAKFDSALLERDTHAGSVISTKDVSRSGLVVTASM